MQVTDTQIQYTWEQDTFDNPGDYATAICVGNGLHRFAAIWNPVSQSGYLGRWSPTTSKWVSLGGNFKNPINQMCADNKGNVYMVGDKGSQGDYVIKIYASTSNSWKEAGNKFTIPLTKICCDIYTNVYVAGGGENVQMYSLAFNSWKVLTGENFTQPILDMCVASDNNLFVLSTTSEGKYFVSYYNTQGSSESWTTIDLSGYSDVEAITCDEYGNLYFNTTTTIYSYNLSSKVFKDLEATIPSFSGTFDFFLLCIDDILYFAGYYYTGPVTTSAFVQVYSYSIWTDITPPQFAKSSFEVVYDIASYDGKSNNILVASNLNYMLDGKKLNK